MNLVKWLRKNNTKIMAIVVVVLMVGFIGGSYIQQFAHRTGRPTETIASYGQGGQISQMDLSQAQQELEVLKMSHMDMILHTQDLRNLLLGELLFPEHNVSVELIGQIKEIVKGNGYKITDRQIDDIYRGTMSAGAYWLLLKKEAQEAGVAVSREDAGNLMAAAIPQLFKGATYQQVMSSFMQQGMSEEEILSAVSDLLAVMQYAKIVCSNENLTSNQIMHEISREGEKMNAQLARIDSALFEKQQTEPQQQIEEQFNRYKAFLQGDANDGNPYGFGYKQPARIQLEYLGVMYEDVVKIIPPPSSQELEDYYQKHIEDFMISYRSDPNDMNSPVIKKPRGYGEVASIITRILTRDQVIGKAEELVRQAKELIESRLQSANVEVSKLTSEQLKQLSGDYETAARQIGEKNNIKIYAGKTGLLSAEDMLADERLVRCYVSAYKNNPVPLIRVLMAANDLGVSELGPFDPPKPKLYEDIGPVSGMGKSVTMLIRVIQAQKAMVPQNVTETFSIAGLGIGPDANKPQEKIYSVKDNVVKDLEKLAAMETARTKAAELIEMVKKDGWNSAIAKFNRLYPSKDAKEPNSVRLQNLTDMERLSREMLRSLAAEDAGDPTMASELKQAREQYLLREHLYSLIPADSNKVAELPTITEFKPNVSFYCLKSLTVKRLNTNEYDKLKDRAIFREDYAQSQAMAAVHFNPDEIVKRMNFKWTKKEMQLIHPEEAPLPDGDF